MKKIIKISVALLIVIAITAVSTVALFACQEKKEYLEEDTTFYLTTFTVLQLPLVGGLDSEQSYIKLNKDGTCTMRITPTQDLINLGNSLLPGIYMPGNSLESFSYQYLSELLPGFDITDVSAGLALLEGSLGVKLVGLEDGNPEYESLKEQIESGKGLNGVTLPSGLAIEVNTVYNIKKLHSEYSGDYTAVYIGSYDSSYSQEPYLIFTLYQDEYGRDCLKYRFEVLKADIDSVAR